MIYENNPYKSFQIKKYLTAFVPTTNTKLLLGYGTKDN